MARVLVTGATGQIGSYACEALVDSGHVVLGVGSPASSRALPANVVAARGAWARDGLETLLFDNGALDAVIHAGAPTDVPRSWRALGMASWRATTFEQFVAECLAHDRART